MESTIINAINSGGVAGVILYLIIREFIIHKKQERPSPEKKTNVSELAAHRQELKIDMMESSIAKISESLCSISCSIKIIADKVASTSDKVDRISSKINTSSRN